MISVHGSFTGIRIGVATVKAFVDSLNKQSIGISSLETLAYNVTNNGVVCSLIDARKENVYCQIFQKINDNYITRRNYSFENINNLIMELKSLKLNYEITFVGDASIVYKEKILKYLPNSKFVENNSLSAKNVGVAGFNHYKNQELLSLEPLYLRKSQAEQKLEEKQSESK